MSDLHPVRGQACPALGADQVRNGIDKTNTITSAKIQSVLPDRLALTTGDRAELQGLVFASALSAKVGAAPPSDTRVLVLEDYVFITACMVVMIS